MDKGVAVRIWEADGIIWFDPWPLAFIVFMFGLWLVVVLISFAWVWIADRTS